MREICGDWEEEEEQDINSILSADRSLLLHLVLSCAAKWKLVLIDSFDSSNANSVVIIIFQSE